MPADLNLFFLLPEIAIMVTVSLLAILEIAFPEMSRRFVTQLNLIGVAVVGAALVSRIHHSGVIFQGTFAADTFALFFKFLFLGTAAIVILMKKEESLQEGKAEFHLLLWSALLGMFFLVSAKDFLLFFIALELLTLSLYILTAYSRTHTRSIEAGLKYLILGSLASAFLLYGISLIYASTGTLSFDAFRSIAQQGMKGIPWLFAAGFLLVLSALCFKVAAFPFQIWVPDVYQGAPTPVVAFLSVASKSAGFAALLRLLFGSLGPMEMERQILFSILAALTLLYGNLGALVQKDMKRLLGYSSIGHAGFLLIAVASEHSVGGKALLYYLIAYAVTNLAAFFTVSIFENSKHENQKLSGSVEDYRGLSERAPLLAAAMFLAFLSLAGVPPLAGFFSKFLVLLAAAKSKLAWLVILAAVNVAISLYYYLNVIRVLYFEKAEVHSPISLSMTSKLLLCFLMAGVVLVGLWQAPFFKIVTLAAKTIS